MSNFLYYTNRLRQYVPSLSPEQAEEYVNHAWRDIRQSNDEWTFLYETEYWLAPASIGLQGLGVIQFDDSVELNYTNLVQLSNQNNPALTQRQLRFGPSGGPIYGIADVDVQSGNDGNMNSGSPTLTAPGGIFDPSMVGLKIQVNGAGVSGADLQTEILSYSSPTQVNLAVNASTTVANANFYLGSTITLDRPFLEETNSNTSATCYRIYYSPTSQDFDRLDHIYDPIMGYEFAIDIRDRSELDMIDPRRTSQGQPYRLYFHSYNDETGLPVYEMWPGPRAQRGYTVSYWRKGMDFVNDTDSLPPRLSEELLLMRARILAYEWAMVNDPDPAKMRAYGQALSYARSRYSTEGVPGRELGLLDQAIRRDRSIALTKYRRFPRTYGPGWPLFDSNFNQNHAIPSGAYGG